MGPQIINSASKTIIYLQIGAEVGKLVIMIWLNMKKVVFQSIQLKLFNFWIWNLCEEEKSLINWQI